jgi:endoglucanase
VNSSLTRLLIVLIIVCFSNHTARAATNAFIPGNPPEMKRLTGHDSPAHRAIKLFRRGTNLGNYLESRPAYFSGAAVSTNEFKIMHDEGFDHVRIPIAWHHYAGPAPDFVLTNLIFSRVDFVVTNALKNQLAVIINIHHFNEFDRDPIGQTEKFLAIWRQIAAHYAEYPNTVAFELENEPHDAATTVVVNPIFARAIAEIRKTNPQRTIFVDPGDWGKIGELKNLVLPADDNNIIVSAHCYEPFHFTHQGAGWAGPDVKVTGIQFPGPPEKPLVPDPSLKLNPWVITWIERYNTLPTEKNPSSPAAFEGDLKYARDWSDYYGRPVHIGEFGCYVVADPESRARFHAAFRKALDANQLPWAMWDWSSNFGYWDKQKNQPMPGLRAAMFGK